MSALLNHRLKAALGLGVAWIGRTPEEIEDFLNSYEAEVLREAAAKIRHAYSGDEPDHSWVNNPFDAADLIDPDKEG